MITNTCPNCGAPISGDRCEYCGASFGRKSGPCFVWDVTGISCYANDIVIMTVPQTAEAQREGEE